MPAVGDQHRTGSMSMSASNSASITANPFEDPTTRIHEYTAQQIATLQSRLDKRLGPEYLSSRQGPGGQRVHYISADKCINLANEVFGFNGWSSSIQNIQVDFVDEESNTGKVSLGLSVIIRVTLKDGTFHEDIGYGHIENCKGKAAAFEKAKKEGTTDALKRTLRTFGNVLGNCIYDKEYLSKVTKVKAIPTKWDVDKLHRHSEFDPVKKAPVPPTTETEPETRVNPATRVPSVPKQDVVPAEFEAEFGSDLFDEADFSEQHTLNPDEVVLDQQPPQNNGGTYGLERNHNDTTELETPSKPQRTGPVGGDQSLPLPPPADRVRPNIHPINQHSTPVSKPPSAPRPQPLPQNNTKPIAGKQTHTTTSAPNLPPSNLRDQQPVKPDPSLNKENNSPTKPPSPSSSQMPEDKRPEDPAGGFYSARAAEALKSNPYNPPKGAPTFDPHFNSPSIRKTAGFNHNTSAPVAKNTYQILPPQFPKTGQPPQNANALPSGSQSTHGTAVPDAHKRAPAPAAANNRGTSYPKIEPVAAYASPARTPLTTSYRPPIRRSMAEGNSNVNAATSAVPAPNANTATAQNANGKRPPLSDMTNVTTAAVDDSDQSKKAKTAEAGGAGGGVVGVEAQHSHQV